MSKLLDNIQCNNERERRAQMNFLNITEEYLPGDFMAEDYQTLYSLTATIGTKVWATPQQLPQIKRMTYRAIQDEVFGEFRKPLIEAMMEARQGNYDNVLEKLYEIEKAMFSV